MNVELRYTYGLFINEFSEYFDLRLKVFSDYKTMTDDLAYHVMACVHDKIIGVGSIANESSNLMRGRYLCVNEAFRGNGIGGLILELLEGIARKAGVNELMLRARDSSIEFFKRKGYVKTGDAESIHNVKRYLLRKKL